MPLIFLYDYNNNRKWIFSHHLRIVRTYLIYWFIVFNLCRSIPYITEASTKEHYVYFANFQGSLISDAVYISLYTLLFPRNNVWICWEGQQVRDILLVLMDVALRLWHWILTFLFQGNGHMWHHVLYLCVCVFLCMQAHSFRQLWDAQCGC